MKRVIALKVCIEVYSWLFFPQLKRMSFFIKNVDRLINGLLGKGALVWHAH